MNEDKIKYMFELYRASCEANKMRAVARLFGKRLLGEEFIISVRQVKYVALFSYDGLEIYNANYDCWQVNYELLVGLLTGEAVIVGD